MSVRTSQVFSVGAIVEVEAADAFAFLADGMNQTYWALGSWDRRRLADDTFGGTSMFDGSELVVRLVPRPELLQVDFEVGAEPGALAHAVQARVIPGPTLGHAPTQCLVLMTVFRGADTPDDTWERLWHCFETEIHMVKGRIERPDWR